jgi:hypothetical protein
MGASTGVVFAIGGITLFNDVIINRKPIEQDVRVIVGTAIAAAGLALLERVSPRLAVGVAWVGLVTVLFVRVDPNVPTPVESFSAWYDSGALVKKGMRGTRT